MSILKLKPSCKDYLWGGNRLKKEYGMDFEGDVLAEAWALSCHPDGPSYIVNGVYKGKTLQEFIDAEGKSVLGTNCRRFRDFPILTKFIDAKDNLSIQVHPDNQYALKHEAQYGKTEMWYVLDAGENAFLYYGFKKEISKEEFSKRIKEDTLLEVLNAVPVQKGDVLFIEAGTIHAIGKDILIAEIQQNSNVTYRVYDYGRVGKDGKKRDLHIEKALSVTNRVPIIKDRSSYPHVADCDYFTIDRLNLDGKVMKKMEGNVLKESFASILILDGQGEIICDGEKLFFSKGDSFFLTAGSGQYIVEGVCDALITTIREKAAPVRIGVDIGATDTYIGLVDIHDKLLAYEKIKTDTIHMPQDMLQAIGQRTLALLEGQGISVDQCVGAGIGVAGTIDSNQGVVRYSNNIGWKDVEIRNEMGKYLPIPIKVFNNADCAAIGETVSGAGKEYQDVIMLTIGAGVGGGIVIDGKTYKGKGVGGSELGHMVIVEDGETCTCGRKGCLEAYVSLNALLRDAKKISGREYALNEIFEGVYEKDDVLTELINSYTKRLGIGIVNLINIFRPQVVILGGEISEYARELVTLLSDIIKDKCFGGKTSELPEIKIAELGNFAGIIGAANLL